MGYIYLIDGDDQLTELTAQGYDSESLLQELLAKYPNLLAGDQIDDAEPRRWLLVSREMRLASEEGGAQRWSVDHLFLDQDGIPTIVEVKQSSDTRIRREVIGQMLDYAANAIVYWPVDGIREQFSDNCGEQDPEEILEEFLTADAEDTDVYVGEFWQKVETNLQIGKVRMLFVADRIPRELQRVVEFLNKQMTPAEVLAVEIKLYASQDGLRTLVPRVIGQTAEAQQRRSRTVRETRSWDETAWFEELEARRGDEEVAIVRKVQEWATKRSLTLYRSSYRKDERATFWMHLDHKGFSSRLFGFRVDGNIEVRLIDLNKHAPFDDERKRLELVQRLNEISGITISDAARTLRGYPSFPISALASEDALRRFIETFDWCIQQAQETHGG